jgi:GGDEF domain-containing protein
VLIMPGLRPEVFSQHAERFPRVVQRAGYNVCGENLMSMSVGLAAFPTNGRGTDALLSEAGRRMYEPKNRKKALLSGSTLSDSMRVESTELVTPTPPSLARR